VVLKALFCKILSFCKWLG